MINNKLKKTLYQQLHDKIEKDIVIEELMIKVAKGIREGIRQEMDRVADRIKGIDEEIERVTARRKEDMADKKIAKEQEELFDVKHKYELDIDKMKEQMMGKWIETEERYRGGMDEEIKVREKNIESRKELVGVIEREIKII